MKKIIYIFSRDFNQWTNQMIRNMYFLEFPHIWGKGLRDQMVHYTTRTFVWYRYDDDYANLCEYMIKKPTSAGIFSKAASLEFRKNIDTFRQLISKSPDKIKNDANHYMKIKFIFLKMYPWYALSIFIPGQWREGFLTNAGRKGEEILEMLYKNREYSEGILKLNDNFMRSWIGPKLEKLRISKDYLKLMSIQEIEDFVLRGKTPDKKILDARSTGFFYIDNKIYPTNSLEQFLKTKDIYTDKISMEKVLKGIVACKGGVVQGKVKVVLNTNEITKFEKDCILVTAMTSPEYGPIIEKARAIVTDEGGITSHIAIVARELSKPSIMATKYATQLFKDGDLIEVDTDIGTVKLLKGHQNLGWSELAHETRGYIYPTALYRLGAQRACEEIGFKESIIGCYYKDNEFSYLTADNSLAKAGKLILEKLKQDKNFLSKIVQVNKKEIPLMLESAEKLSGDLHTVTGKELFRRWQDWLNKFLHMMTYSVMGTVLEMEEPLLSNELLKILEKKTDKTGEYFQILTTPILETIAIKEENALLKLRLKQLNKGLTQNDLKNHTKKYGYVAFGYTGPGFNGYDVQERLKTLPNKIKDIKSMIIKKKKQIPNLIQKQEKICRELKLSAKESYLFYCLRTLGFWKFERKAMNQKAHEFMEDFFKELASRLNLKVEQAKMILPEEMKDALLGRIDKKIITQRKECFVLFDGTKMKILSQEETRKIIEQINKEYDVSITELKGSTAYPGKAKGIVKIVNSLKDANNFNKGDILISASTSPDIVPIMKKASAIVTDTGGITSHAAIIAREIKIPTLIGTKKASKIFKDGELAEVDASLGYIRKLK